VRTLGEAVKIVEKHKTARRTRPKKRV